MVDEVVEFERTGRRWRSLDYGAHEDRLAELAASIERESHGVSLSSLNETAARLLIDGVEYVRVLADVSAEYKTRVGPVPVSRSLYRCPASAGT